MTDTALLAKKIDGLPANYRDEIADFVSYIEHKASVAGGWDREEAAKKPPLDQTLAKIWALCKDVPISVDSFLEERHAETEAEEAKYRA
jgi:hypothetical protein